MTADIQSVSDQLSAFSLGGSKDNSDAAATSKKRQMPPPPISVGLGNSNDNDNSNGSLASKGDPIPPTPIITEITQEEPVRPSLEMVARRRGGVCLTEPNHRTVVTMSQIKDYYEKA
ncbi:hypothetical protein HDU76_010987 [Blyttiomyces sp. JEL0837]|nr:hypothetical protein HDU76_010987 [Blyttiomyces sp. JEL0837]